MCAQSCPACVSMNVVQHVFPMVCVWLKPADPATASRRGSFFAGGLVKSQRDGKGTAEVEGSGIAGNGEAEGSFEVDAREGQRS